MVAGAVEVVPAAGAEVDALEAVGCPRLNVDGAAADVVDAADDAGLLPRLPKIFGAGVDDVVLDDETAGCEVGAEGKEKADLVAFDVAVEAGVENIDGAAALVDAGVDDCAPRFWNKDGFAASAAGAGLENSEGA